jgi:hypothetical protein
MKLRPNRIVVFLTPLVFAPAAGWVTAWVAKNLPGVPALDTTQVTALFIAGATIAFGKAALWLHGWHIHMRLPEPPEQETAQQLPDRSGSAPEQQDSPVNGAAPELQPA